MPTWSGRLRSCNGNHEIQRIHSDDNTDGIVRWGWGMRTFIAIDFDGTIVEHRFPEIGKPVPGAIEWMKKFQEAGAELILWTMRSDVDERNYLSEAVGYCRDNGIRFEHVNQNPQDWTTSPKAYAHVYIDDSAACCPLRVMGTGARVVDWDIVGPVVMQEIALDATTVDGC